MAGKHREVSFWVSYSDLATALMIVFVVVMLMMVAVAMRDREAQTSRIEDLASQIQVILGARQSLASAISDAIEEASHVGQQGSAAMPVVVDPVTAQLSIPETLLSFETDSADLTAEGRAFLDRFAPAYFCALWRADDRRVRPSGEGSPVRIDPDVLQGVRRVLVSGHTDLKGTFAQNADIGARRAKTVTTHIHDTLARCASERGCGSVPAACAGYEGDVYRYAQERIWAANAGYTAHCSAAWADDTCDRKGKRAEEGCSAMSCSADAFRRVDFVLELTGDDMTGMLLDVLALQREVSGMPPTDLVEMAVAVGTNCMGPDPTYQGCEHYRDHCGQKGADGWEECAPFRGDQK